jgi:hypothetical protein
VEVLFDAIRNENVHPCDRRAALIRAGHVAQAYVEDTQLDAKLLADVFGATSVLESTRS